MGNQNSRSTTPASSPQSPVGSAGTSHGHGHDRTLHPHAHAHAHAPSALHPAQARRRESIQAISTAKATPAPPTLTTTTAPASTHTSADNTAASMGNEQSSNKATPPEPEPAQPQSEVQPPQQPQQPARPDTPPQAVQPSPPTQPVDVPAATDAAVHDDPSTSIGSLDPATASQDYLVPSSHFSRPPRLPLPIEEEVHTPGSPIISPTDVASPIDHGEIEGALPRRTSMLSSTTADDDDLGEEFKTPTGRVTVPTLIEWEGAGERVYVTGTFAGWNRKYRLHADGPSEKKGALSAHVPIHPGTHHLMFIVDNDMMISDKLPTAVDYTNILVNYLEVSYDDVSEQTPAEAKADAETPVQERPAPEGIYPPQTLPPSPTPAPVKPPVPEVPDTTIPEPTKKYHQNIPKYLLDLDAPEESSRFARANAAASNLPTPPSLPMFLSKSILNGTTPMKDDSSVLIMPNHTVLNHLATSSIKDNILATSATTRYKQKFLTTIMYKPKEESEDRVH